MAILRIKDENGNWVEISAIRGEDGKDGEKGESATIQIGEVKTLEPYELAYVENVGDESEAIFNFGIPRGEDGTVDLSNYYNKTEIDSMIGDIESVLNEVV